MEITDEPFELYLQDNGCNEGLKEAESGGQKLFDGFAADLEEGDEEEGRGTKKTMRAAA